MLDKIGQCLKFKQSGQILKHWKLQNRPWRRPFFIIPNYVQESLFVPSLLFPAVFALTQDGNQLFIKLSRKTLRAEVEITKSSFFFLSFFLHTWLYLLMTPALIMLVIPGLLSYNGAEVYYLKGVIEQPIIISFLDSWYYFYFFFFWNGLIDDVIVIGWTDSDFRIFRALGYSDIALIQSDSTRSLSY